MKELIEYRRDLETRGVTRADSLIPKSDVLLARDLIYEIASDHGHYSSNGWRPTDGRFVVDKPFRAALKSLIGSSRFPNLIGKPLVSFAGELVGAPVTALPPGQQILFTPPGAASWSVPHDVWHIDAARLGPLGPSGLQMFACLDDLEPQGGGTLVVSGSHRLFNGSDVIRSKQLKRLLGEKAYFRRLFDSKRDPITCLEETVGADEHVDLEVVELTGDIGDVWFMDLRALHAPAPNASRKARIMLTCRLPRAAVASRLLHPEAGASD